MKKKVFYSLHNRYRGNVHENTCVFTSNVYFAFLFVVLKLGIWYRFAVCLRIKMIIIIITYYIIIEVPTYLSISMQIDSYIDIKHHGISVI